MPCTAQSTSGLPAGSTSRSIGGRLRGRYRCLWLHQLVVYITSYVLESPQQLQMQAGLQWHNAITIMTKHLSCAYRGAEAAALVANPGGGACGSTSSRSYVMSYSAVARDAMNVIRKQNLSAAGMQRLQHWWQVMGAVPAAPQARSSM